VVMFRSKNRRVAFRPENGMAVTVRGYVTVFERDGVYQLYAEEMEPDGAGALHLAFEQLKAKLQKEGLFDRKHKKELPFLPRRIGIVTSPAGAAVRDMLEIIKRRWPGRAIIIVPAAVQGETAPAEIARGIALLNRLGDVDVIITGRGGGSLEELWAFNTEMVARAIFASRVPVISAVGHETDVTIADFVADVRAATPSNAAELVVPDRMAVERHLAGLRRRLLRAGAEAVRQGRRRLTVCLARPVFTRPADVLCGARQQEVDYLARRLAQGVRSFTARAGNRLAVLSAALNALSPLATLARGYSICTTPSGKVVGDAADVETGSRLDIYLHRGSLQCLVESKK
ncbi:MAG: exodeoxyribonuclease VII large subunit, partial [Peptococcaceae bacterium]|nr:exodeoxyribonuclease VII large subunit [Peptococcaceae bacterium]